MAVENYLTYVTVNLSNYAQGLQQPTIHRVWSLTWMTFACFTNWSPDHAKIVDLWNAQSQQGFPGPSDNHSPDSDAEWAQWGYSSGSDED
ncbi:hypothetical protein K469DRAFT_721978 [Zopfia rhizophila CBS 207.26]|uniref:Uncharacterized protein n=1 Tax=Zopfia rhizophila CBS 207.26 TaxID=1314779 RepID=A0A6A6DGQ1_9PEZI|nr:hypothetical protein K469DRAFT_721978 [Zopfia rhizophila CBS 207.26]